MQNQIDGWSSNSFVKFIDNIQLSGGCWNWRGHKNKDGYGVFKTTAKLSVGKQTAHRQAFLLWKADIPDGMVVMHTCDNPGCVNPDHLLLGTNKQNVADKVLKGRQAKGETSGRAKLNSEAILKIREEPRTRGFTRKLAAQYGVTPVLISAIRNRKTWKHIL